MGNNWGDREALVAEISAAAPDLCNALDSIIAALTSGDGEAEAMKTYNGVLERLHAFAHRAILISG